MIVVETVEYFVETVECFVERAGCFVEVGVDGVVRFVVAFDVVVTPAAAAVVVE